MMSWLRYLALLPLALDTLVISGSLAVVPARRRQAQLTFILAEASMPVVGLAAGRAVMPLLPWLSAAGGALVMALGLREWLEPYWPKRRSTRAVPLWALALSLSIDELGLGFGLGSSHLSVPLAALWIAGQTLFASTVGFLLREHIMGWHKEGAERVAASGLILVGALVVLHWL